MLARSTRLAAGACKLHVPLCSDDAMLCAFGPPSQRGAPPGPPARGLCTTSTLQATGPEATVYSGPATADRKRVTLRHIRKKYLAGDKLSMVTAYDYPSAKHVRATHTRVHQRHHPGHEQQLRSLLPLACIGTGCAARIRARSVTQQPPLASQPTTQHAACANTRATA